MTVDEYLVDGWMTALASPVAGPVPDTLIQRWREELSAAVAQARVPSAPPVTGRYLVLDRYLSGVAAGLAAAVATSPASAAEESDPIILAAGLLAGLAALRAVSTEVADYEVDAARAAAAAMVDAAAAGAGLLDAIGEAHRAAGQVRARSMVGIALDALLRGLVGTPTDDEPDGVYEIRLLLEPVDHRIDLDTVAVDRMLDGLSDERRWIPDATGFRLVLITTRPGPLVETVFGFGRVRQLRIRHLG
ncbi:MAG: hypothetical protein ABJA16_05440 [Nakamurella sp.]